MTTGRTVREMLLGMLTLLAVAYLAVAALAWFLGERVIFQPPPPSYPSGPRVVMIRVGEDSVAARWLPHPSARYTLLLSHGNAEDIGHLEPLLQRLREAGFSVLAYDYRGYGRSTPRRAGERLAYRDHEAVYRYLTGALGVPAERVILHGRSLGGGVASELAVRCPAAGLVLESTFTSALRVVAPRVLPFDRFATLERLPRITMPILVVHGDEDGVIPIAHGRALHAAAGPAARSFWAVGAGHDDVAVVAGDAYFAALRDFAGYLAKHGSRGDWTGSAKVC